MKMMGHSRELAGRHYAEHRSKPFYDGLIAFITSGPVVAMIWEGREAVTVVRSLMGSTDPLKAQPGTIRGDLALDLGMNRSGLRLQWIGAAHQATDRKSTRLNSSHANISYAVFCLKKKKQ